MLSKQCLLLSLNIIVSEMQSDLLGIKDKNKLVFKKSQKSVLAKLNVIYFNLSVTLYKLECIGG